MRIGCFSDFIYDSGVDIDPALLQLMEENDLNCLNFEAPLLPINPKPIDKGINLYQRTDGLEFLRRHRFDVVNLANNHIFDFGWSGLESTIRRLDVEGIQHFGAGEDLASALEPAVIRCAGKAVAFWGFAWDFTDAVNAGPGQPGTAPVKLDLIRQALEAGRQYDLRIVYFHFGIEFEDLPDCYQKHVVDELMRLDLADVVIGTHPHCVQGVVESDGPRGRQTAFFSLGNFVIPTGGYMGRQLTFPAKSRIGFAVMIDFASDTVCTMVPYRLSEDHCRVRLLDDRERAEFKEHIDHISKPLRLTGLGYMYHLARNRKRHHLPLFGRSESRNRVLMASYRGVENAAVRMANTLGVRGLIRASLQRRVE